MTDQAPPWPLLGAVVAYPLSAGSLPKGCNWLICDGSPVPEEYPDLAAALGSPNLPNYAGRTLIGSGTPDNSPQSDGTRPNFPGTFEPTAGQTGGEFDHALLANEMPPHSHATKSVYGYDIYEQPGDDIHLDCTTDYTTGDRTDVQGGNASQTVDPHNTMQPYMVVNYIIYAGEPG